MSLFIFVDSLRLSILGWNARWLRSWIAITNMVGEVSFYPVLSYGCEIESSLVG
uniref:Uncharacterized protein n=1 Tax=Rhizophagus irregularis (strain DAOM 181602 / DAOM 197198 / MUCL 43194) TaxID=747089 RepID=U9UHJ8_RHIID